MSEQSESIKELATALAKAQGKITGALKDSENPFFKSSYADLASCWDACREALSANELSVVQTLDREGYLVTTLLHSSGEWIRSAVKMIPKDDSPQAIGSCITYMRRYSLAAIVGIAQVDDDANAATGKGEKDWTRQDTLAVKKEVDRFLRASQDHDMGVVASQWREFAHGRPSDDPFMAAVWAKFPNTFKTDIKAWLLANPIKEVA